MSARSIGLTGLVLFGLVSSAFSAPTNTRSGPPITNGTNSTVYPDTEDKARLWVLPPTSGRAGPAQLSLETPEAECDSMNNIIESARSYSKQVKILATQRENLLKRLEDITDKNTTEATDLYSQTEKLNTIILSAYKTMNDLTSGSARLHGGTLLVPYLHDQDQDIIRIKQANPAYQDVRPVDTYHARMYFTAPGSVATGVDLSLIPIINSYSVAGTSAEKLADTPAQVSNRVDVTLSLTRMGACLMAFPQKFGSKTAPKFGMTAIYEFHFAFKTTIRASYNLKNIYRFVTESGTKGGLFSSKYWARTMESNWGESAIKFFWSDDDPESKISAADRLEIEKSVKGDLLANLDKLIFAQTGVKPYTASNPGPRGATVLGDGLEKNPACVTNAYCAAAAIAVRVLDATFGSSSMSTEIERKLDVTTTYSSDALKTRYVSQGISYAGD